MHTICRLHTYTLRGKMQYTCMLLNTFTHWYTLTCTLMLSESQLTEQKKLCCAQQSETETRTNSKRQVLAQIVTFFILTITASSHTAPLKSLQT